MRIVFDGVMLSNVLHDIRTDRGTTGPDGSASGLFENTWGFGGCSESQLCV